MLIFLVVTVMFLNCAMEKTTNHNKQNLKLSDFIYISMIHSLRNVKIQNYLPTVDPICFTVAFISYREAVYAQ